MDIILNSMNWIDSWWEFILADIAIILTLILEDYLLWRLWVIKAGGKPLFLKASNPRQETMSPPRNNPLYDGKSNEATYNETDNNTIDKDVVTQELDSGGNKPEDKTQSCQHSNVQEYVNYRLLIGFRHLLNPSKYSMCIDYKKGKQPNANNTIFYYANNWL